MLVALERGVKGNKWFSLIDKVYSERTLELERTGRGRLIRLVRPKSLRKLRETLKAKTRRNNGQSMEAIIAEVNRTLKSWYGYFKHVHPCALAEIDRWLRVRVRSFLRKRRKGKGRARG